MSSSRLASLRRTEPGYDVENPPPNTRLWLGIVASRVGATITDMATAARISRTAIANLLTNALKFTHQGSIALTASSVAVDKQHFRLHISIQDTGIGIAADRKHRLFQVFSQVDSSTTRQYGGSGLGLAICRRLAQAMSGDIDVASESGQGTTFNFHVLLDRKSVV